MKLISPTFHDGGIIPSIHTCEGKNLPPPIAVSAVPKDAISLVLIMDDPDVPASVRADKMYDHWVLFNIAPTATNIDENSGTPGKNTSGKNGYIGPCPPDREHRYFFKLYALDILLNLPAGATKKEVEKAMHGHIIAHTQMIGRYEQGKGY
jgi:Raf kinase inhibitor-like YbhB/YbcL family protein